MKSLTVAILLCLTFHCCPDSAGEELDLRAKTGNKPRLLVLASGNVVRGDLFPRAGGYDVKLPAGRMFVPEQQIRFVASDIDSAYRMMRDSVADLTPDAHLTLARWCLANHIPRHAKREVLDALHLDPFRDDARRMLESLAREERRDQSSDKTVFSRHEIENPGVLPQRRSLGGLRADLAQTFTRRIQPLISNKCGNARCHGDGRNSFAVFPIGSHSTAAVAEKNLASIIGQLDSASPLNSPLLKAADGSHGGSNRPLFPGRTGRLQMQSLRDWVLGVSEEFSGTPADTTLLANSSAEHSQPDASAQSFTGERDEEFLRSAGAAVRDDQFNPAQFNLKYHGRTGSPSSTRVRTANGIDSRR